MWFDYVVDRIFQYLFLESIDLFVKNVSNFLSRVVCKLWPKKFSLNKKFLFKLVVLYRSDNFLVIDKPPDMLINSNDRSQITVQTILSNQLPELKNKSLKHEFYFAHRLDFSTSGILCIPLHRRACASLSKSFQEQKCEKIYIALVNGHVQKESYDINLAIGEDDRYVQTSKQMCTIGHADVCRKPRIAHTHLVRLSTGTYGTQPISKVLLQAITGRRHQLRLHCLELGHPILGDYTYGLNTDKKMPRMFLHAIELHAPNDVEDLHITIDDPFKDIEAKYSPGLSVPSGLKILKNKFN